MVGRDRRRADHHLGAEGPEELTLLVGDLVRHREDAPVAPLGRHHGQPDAGVPRRRLHDRPPVPQQTTTLGLVDHLHRRPVLHAAPRVQVLQLGQQVAGEIPSDAVEAHQRRVADEVEDAVRYLHRRPVVVGRQPLDALGRLHPVLREEHGREAGPMHRPGHLDRLRRLAADTHQARDPAAEGGDEGRGRAAAWHPHDMVGSPQQHVGRRGALGHQQHVDPGRQHATSPGRHTGCRRWGRDRAGK